MTPTALTEIVQALHGAKVAMLITVEQDANGCYLVGDYPKEQAEQMIVTAMNDIIENEMQDTTAPQVLSKFIGQ